MSRLQAGFARVDITPPLGVPIAGYYVKRYAEGILDNLEANAIAFSAGEKTAVVISMDIISVGQESMGVYRKQIAEAAGLPYEAVYIACTHTHTGPAVGREEENLNLYDQYLGTRLADAAVLAMADLKPASLSVARGDAQRVAFIRRYRMKDGKIRTNPGVNNPDTLEPIGTPDTMVQLVRIHREGAREIDVVHFQVHPDTIGGCKISADYPRFVRETVENALGGQVYCVYFNGTQGDTNHVNTSPLPGELRGLDVNTFDDVSRGYEHSQHMGRAIAGAALQVWGKTEDVAAGPVSFGQSYIEIPSNRVGPEHIPEAERILALHESGRDDELPYRGMELTTVVAEAARIKRLEHGPDSFTLGLSAVSVGSVAFAGLPGEPFTYVGRTVKKNSPFQMTLPTCLTNGSEGYFPTIDAYKEGGYEARSSRFQAGVAEKLADSAVALLKTL